MRKTVVKKLKKAGVATRDITAITGHKSEESLRDYDDNDISEHRHLSKQISYATTSNPSCSHSTFDTSYYYSQTAYYNPCPPMYAPYYYQERPAQPNTYQFYNCSVNIGAEKEQKRPIVVYSDEDED